MQLSVVPPAAVLSLLFCATWALLNDDSALRDFEFMVCMPGLALVCYKCFDRPLRIFLGIAIGIAVWSSLLLIDYRLGHRTQEQVTVVDSNRRKHWPDDNPRYRLTELRVRLSDQTVHSTHIQGWHDDLKAGRQVIMQVRRGPLLITVSPNSIQMDCARCRCCSAR